MSSNKKFASTMRIDLIPDVPAKEEGDRQRPVIKISKPKPQTGAPAKKSSPDKHTYYQRLLQSLYDAALVTDLEGNVVDANLRALEFLGYDKAALCTLSMGDVVAGVDDALLSTVKENLRNERHTLIQAYCMRRDQSYFPAEIAVTLLDLDRKFFCLFIRDITLRKEAEELLLTEHCAIQNSSNGIAITDLDGNLQYANDAALLMWQHENSDTLMGRRVCGLFQPPEKVTRMLEQLREGGERSLNAELQIQGEGESVRDVRLSGAQNRNSDGEPVGFVFSIDDISDRRRAQQAERESERRRVMIESLGAACDHLGQPSTVLLGNLELMKSSTIGASEDAAKILDGSLKAMEEIVQVLGRLSAAREYKTRPYLDSDRENMDGFSILDI